MGTGKGWAASEWVSAGAEPVVTITSDRNNGFNTSNYNLGRDFKFTISVGDDYSITGYKISTTGGWGTTVVTENDQSEVFSGAAEMTVADLSTNSTWFTTADANLNGPVIDVYLVDALPTGILQTTSTRQTTSLFTPSTGFASQASPSTESIS